MALFGAPLAHEDHAVRACYAALRMQEAVKAYAENRAAPVQIRVGLNSGDVVVRSVGSDLRMDYSAVGQTTHVAARMEQMATPGAVVLSTATMRLVTDWVQATLVGRAPVKGLAEPMDVFELAGVNRVRSRLQARAGQGLTKFVGRTAELSGLADALGQAWAGHGQVVALVAEAGVGKSRICAEFMRSAQAEGCLILEQSIDLRLSLRTSLYPLGDFQRIQAQLQEAEAVALRIDDSLRLGWVSLHTGDYLRQIGNFTDASRYGERAYAASEKVQSLPLQMAASHYLALTCHALGDYRRAAERLRAVIEMAATDATTEEWRTQAGSRAGFLAVNFSWLARTLAETGDFDEAIGFGQQGLELAEHLESPYSLAATTFGLGAVFGMRGEFDRATPA
jgi:hypothetical protein